MFSPKARRYAAIRGISISFLVLIAPFASRAQSGTLPNTERSNKPSKAVHAAPRPKQELSDHAAVPAAEPSRPAKVTLQDGKLAVQADNSDLSQILQQLARVSGMKVQGIVSGQRVFGAYGPGSAREVLSKLLAGSGYNFIMMGDAANGAPTELLLSQQSAARSAAPDTVKEESGQKAADRASAEPRGPGAIERVPPRPPDDEQLRTEQQMQRLARMHELQQTDAAQ